VEQPTGGVEADGGSGDPALHGTVMYPICGTKWFQMVPQGNPGDTTVAPARGPRLDLL